MVQYGIYNHRGQIGILTAEPQGLYEVLTGTLQNSGVMLRLWLVGEYETLLLGTAVPEADKLVCRRTVSHQQLPDKILGAVAIPTQKTIWQRYEAYSYQLTPEEIVIAERYTKEKKILQLPYYPHLLLQQFEDAAWLVRKIPMREFLRSHTQSKKPLEE